MKFPNKGQDTLIKRLEMTKLGIVKNKIFEAADAEYLRMLAVWSFKGETVVFTNGCFDILHRGHVEYLAEAAQYGTRLVVGLNSNDSVRRLKGDTRPVNDWTARAEVLAALGCVDAVVCFDDDTPIRLIEATRPQFLVKGGDYKAEDVVGYDFVKSIGGEVKIIEFVDGYSTTRTLQKLATS
jgi:rfaE bifunctional protein nucleotidyltransferase chain/domain